MHARVVFLTVDCHGGVAHTADGGPDSDGCMQRRARHCGGHAGA